MVFGASDIGLGLKKYCLDDIVSPNARFVLIYGNNAIAIIEPVVGRPVDGELFYIRWQGKELFRRLTRVHGKLFIVSRSKRTPVPKDAENELEIIGRVAFTITMPNRVTDKMLYILDQLCNPAKRRT